MNCTDFKNNLLDFAYGEIAVDEFRGEMERHAADCHGCRQAVEDLSTTRGFLKSWPEAEPGPLLPLVIRSNRFSARGIVRFPWITRLAAAAAVVFLAAGAYLVVTHTTVGYKNGMVEIRIGKANPDELAASGTATVRDVRRLIAESEERQGEKYLDLIQTAYYRLEGERQSDRQSIQQGFDLIKEIYMDQIQKNNQLLEYNLTNTNYRGNMK